MRRRAMILLVEGLDPSVAQELIAQGRLPHLAGLLGAPSSGVCRSHRIPYEASALVTAFTGLSPGDHGCHSYWRCRGENFADPPPVLTPDARPTPYAWEAQPGLKACAVNIFLARARREPGQLNIDYLLAPALRASQPSGLLVDLARNGTPYVHDLTALYTGQPGETFLTQVLDIEDRRSEVLRSLWARDVDLLICGMTLIERVSHFFWSEARNSDGQVAPEGIIGRAYARVDELVGRALELVGPDGNFFLFSEMGFGPLETFVSLDDIFEAHGLLRRTADGGADARRSLVQEAPQGTHGVNLNLRRRHPDGVIERKAEDRVRDEVSALLRDLRAGDAGGCAFEAVVPGEVFHPGDRSDWAPDLVVLPREDTVLPLGHSYWAGKVHRRLQTGWHRRDGLWAGRGAALEARAGVLGPSDVYQVVQDLCAAASDGCSPQMSTTRGSRT